MLVPGWKLAFYKSPRSEETPSVGSRIIANLDGGFFDGLVVKPPERESDNRYQVFLGDKGFRHIGRKHIRRIVADPPNSCPIYRQLVETYFTKFPVDEVVPLDS